MAMTEVAQATVTIIPNMKGAQQAITQQLGAAGSAAGKIAGQGLSTSLTQAVGGKLQTIGGGLTSVGKKLSIVSAGAVLAGKKFMSMAQVQQEAETKLTEIYKTRMGATDEAAQSTMRLASALQKEGVVGDEVALSGAQQLATFATMPETVDALLPSLENLLVQQKGVNGTAQDATQIANLFGKAMQGQTGALKRVGISFTEAQAEVLKYGTEEEKAAMLAQVVTSNVGNMNTEFAKTDAGKIQQAKNTLGDMGERIGATLYPAIASLAGYVSTNVMPVIDKVISAIENNPIIAKVGLAVAAIGPLLIMIGKVATGIGSIIKLLPMLASPAGIAVAAIAGIVAIGVALYKNWDKIKAKASELKDWIVNKWTALKESVKGIFEGIKNAITKPIDAAKNVIKGIIEKIKGFFSFKVSLPKIKLPHFSIQPSGWHLSDLLEGEIPHLGIDWYAQGGIMTKPTLFGGGEAGPEGIIPLNQFWAKMDGMTDSIVSGMAMIMRAQQASGDITIPIYLYPSGPKMGEETVKMYDTYKRQLG